MSRRGLTFLIAAAATGILVVLAWLLPVPYVVLVPGPVTDTLGTVGNDEPVVAISGARTYPTSGHLYLTTVGVVPGSCAAHPTLVTALRAWFDHTDAVEPHQVICPPGESNQQVQRSSERDMSNSQQDAVTAALLQLGHHPTSQSIVVGAVEPGMPAHGVLHVGDTLVAVDGKKVTSGDDLRRLIRAKPVGTSLSITVRRNGSTRIVHVKSADAGDPGHTPVIGITPDLRATFHDIHIKIGISPAAVGGPSAGLAFALGIIDKLTPGDLTAGHTVASTGTIDGFGHVGPIGGIQQKIGGAADNGATVFLAPSADCTDAKAVAPSSMTLVRVDRLNQAVRALHAIASGSQDFTRC